MQKSYDPVQISIDTGRSHSDSDTISVGSSSCFDVASRLTEDRDEASTESGNLEDPSVQPEHGNLDFRTATDRESERERTETTRYSLVCNEKGLEIKIEREVMDINGQKEKNIDPSNMEIIEQMRYLEPTLKKILSGTSLLLSHNTQISQNWLTISTLINNEERVLSIPSNNAPGENATDRVDNSKEIEENYILDEKNGNFVPKVQISTSATVTSNTDQQTEDSQPDANNLNNSRNKRPKFATQSTIRIMRQITPPYVPTYHEQNKWAKCSYSGYQYEPVKKRPATSELRKLRPIVAKSLKQNQEYNWDHNLLTASNTEQPTQGVVQNANNDWGDLQIATEVCSQPTNTRQIYSSNGMVLIMDNNPANTANPPDRVDRIRDFYSVIKAEKEHVKQLGVVVDPTPNRMEQMPVVEIDGTQRGACSVRPQPLVTFNYDKENRVATNVQFRAESVRPNTVKTVAPEHTNPGFPGFLNLMEQQRPMHQMPVAMPKDRPLNMIRPGLMAPSVDFNVKPRYNTRIPLAAHQYHNPYNYQG